MGKINFVSLGCSKNTVDSEQLAGKLTKEGFSVCFNMEEPSFDFVIINTCGFIDKAKEESVNVILEFVQMRKQLNADFKIIVYGCLAQRYKDELFKEIPEIDFLFGIMQDNEIVQTLKSFAPKRKRTVKTENPAFVRQLSAYSHYAYVKISEGCDRHCSFCAIPMIKGRHVSRPIEDIVAETEQLVKNGVKEIILIAQDTSYYGVDLYGERKLCSLLEQLCRTDVHWIRLQYSYPNQFPMQVLDLMLKEKKLCRYLDMPLQHINDRVLDSMNRNITSAQINSLIEKIRSKVSDIALRTTLIVGYPTESKAEFNELKSFVEKTKFDRMGAFVYSREEGTKAALIEDNLSDDEKQERLDELTEIQQEISFDLNQNRIGRTFETLIDRREADYWVGRTQYDSPEVDNEVLLLVKDNPDIQTGCFYNVKITDATEFDLYGSVV
ncbi:MAG: 30S ribosomal protein S12 methylthiotransferase RimO [Bacteroidales bacterium]|nr:30S ribosomal protein S12 methylthiotransferase RimO [Bacteroidales bacterium]